MSKFWRTFHSNCFHILNILIAYFGLKSFCWCWILSMILFVLLMVFLWIPAYLYNEMILLNNRIRVVDFHIHSFIWFELLFCCEWNNILFSCLVTSSPSHILFRYFVLMRPVALHIFYCVENRLVLRITHFNLFNGFAGFLSPPQPQLW